MWDSRWLPFDTTVPNLSPGFQLLASARTRSHRRLPWEARTELLAPGFGLVTPKTAAGFGGEGGREVSQQTDLFLSLPCRQVHGDVMHKGGSVVIPFKSGRQTRGEYLFPTTKRPRDPCSVFGNIDGLSTCNQTALQ